MAIGSFGLYLINYSNFTGSCDYNQLSDFILLTELHIDFTLSISNT
jgi:hypothetical protein